MTTVDVDTAEADRMVTRITARLNALRPGSPQLSMALTRIGMLLEAQAKLNVRDTPDRGMRRRWGWPGGSGAAKAGLVDTGRLLNSIRYDVIEGPEGGVVTVGSYGTPYGAIHELGGTIKPKKPGGRLTIPVARWSKGRRAGDFRLVRIGSLLVDPARMRGAPRGEIPDGAVGFLLARQAVIPSRAYLRPAIEQLTPKIIDILRTLGEP